MVEFDLWLYIIDILINFEIIKYVGAVAQR